MTIPRTCLAALLLCAFLSHSAIAQSSGAASPSATWPAAEIARRTESNPKQFGPLRLDMTEAEVREKLGPPDLVSRRSMRMDSDEYTYNCDYAALGVTLFYAAFDESSPGTVMAIRAKSPCDWTAYGGLKVGMSIDSASKILARGSGGNVTPIGSVGTDHAGLYFQLSEVAVAARLEMGMISVLYVGPNLP